MTSDKGAGNKLATAFQHEAETMAPADTRIIRKPEVLARTGLSEATLYRKIEQGLFPKQLRLSRNCVGWYENEVANWINNLPRAA